ncbi:uncharacterized protein PHACADRAFT_196853 [Phanerochaete carnosa HHB-10118-sp]|uniref:Uncharacterized protein n=1 Tax=Phanerochaete carnosa (strain HHB-10118-sp) TaxID=650164 RepID=K5W5L3_PHACS|nr:uncharacterized protein PHACADRAFT_196853 [Phanerochaete carnosa HHB-10118-sp]EKM54425.1 hypothetical protein PHACADRAFT_196853 [Phanerochaete carnosa HHB-10118-sp]
MSKADSGSVVPATQQTGKDAKKNQVLEASRSPGTLLPRSILIAAGRYGPVRQEDPGTAVAVEAGTR